MLDHDKEPWVAHGSAVYFKDPMGGIDLHGCPHPEAKAQRIVACVNACAGLPSESLDLITSTAIGMVGYVKQRDAARKQRDDLLAALLSIVYKNSEGEYKNSFIDETVLNDFIAEAIEACGVQNDSAIY